MARSDVRRALFLAGPPTETVPSVLTDSVSALLSPFQEVRGVEELYAGTAGREAELLHAALSTATRLALRLQELRKQWGDETDDLELMRARELRRLDELDEDQDGA